MTTALPVRRRGPLALALGMLHLVAVLVGAVALTLAFFLVLPLFQAIAKPPDADLVVSSIDAVNEPPPPPPPEEEKEEEKEEEQEPPKLEEQAPPLDLSQLELALNPGFSGDFLAGDFGVRLDTVAATAEEVDALFSLSDLDQKPRVVHQPAPTVSAKMRAKAPATVYIIFIVDENGRVQQPIVQESTDPIFDAAALAAVKQWKFEPGKRGGESVRFRMRVPISFPK